MSKQTTVDAKALADLHDFIEYVRSGEFYSDYDRSTAGLRTAGQALAALATPPAQGDAAQPGAKPVAWLVLGMDTKGEDVWSAVTKDPTKLYGPNMPIIPLYDIPTGWVVVPVEPTKAMIQAGDGAKDGCVYSGRDSRTDSHYVAITPDLPRTVYSAMLTASPAAPQGGAEQ